MNDNQNPKLNNKNRPAWQQPAEPRRPAPSGNMHTGEIRRVNPSSTGEIRRVNADTRMATGELNNHKNQNPQNQARSVVEPQKRAPMTS